MCHLCGRADVAEGKAALARDRRRDHGAEATCLEAEGKLLQATGKRDSGIALLKRAVALEGMNQEAPRPSAA
jgi:hypothetical protein